MNRAFQVVLTGTMPLIMHADSIEWADAISARRTEIKHKDKKNFSAGDDRCPPDTWKGYLYSDGEKVCITTDNLRSCLVQAGKRVAVGKSNMKKLAASAFWFQDLYASFTTNNKSIVVADVNAIDGSFSQQAKGAAALGFKLFAKRARVGQAKHVRVRPMFQNWKLEASFMVIDDQITDDMVQQIWEVAGKYIGLCDWRPDSKESPGPYGCFNAEVQRVA